MPLRWRAGNARGQHTLWIICIVFSAWITIGAAMSPAGVAEMRKETVKMFYHGYDNYMNVAFPEDEVSI